MDTVGKKLFSERMCRHFMEDYGLEVRVARYHNIYGPFGTYDGEKRKSTCRIMQKSKEAKKKRKTSLMFGAMVNKQELFLYRRMY